MAKGKTVDVAARLTGPEKAAVILLALGEEHAQVWKQLDEDEIKEISQAMASLGTVSSQAVEDLLVEFVSGVAGTGSLMGSFEQTQKLLASIMPSEKSTASTRSTIGAIRRATSPVPQPTSRTARGALGASGASNDARISNTSGGYGGRL